MMDTHFSCDQVGDLGLSKVKCQTLISGGVRGTLPWMAPELLNGSSSLVSEKVLVFTLLFLRRPLPSSLWTCIFGLKTLSKF